MKTSDFIWVGLSLSVPDIAADRSSVTDANIHTFQSNNTIIKIIYFIKKF